jgi:hypothetical protein
MWTLRKVDQKYLEGFEMWYCRKMEMITWTEHVKNEEVLDRVEDRNVLHRIKTRLTEDLKCGAGKDEEGQLDQSCKK